MHPLTVLAVVVFFACVLLDRVADAGARWAKGRAAMRLVELAAGVVVSLGNRKDQSP